MDERKTSPKKDKKGIVITPSSSCLPEQFQWICDRLSTVKYYFRWYE